MERLVYEQKSHLHYLIFNVSIPGITGLKRHQKKMGRLKTRQGDAHNISPYGFSPKPAQRRKPQASPAKEGGSPEPQASSAALGSARGSRRLQDHQTRRLRNRCRLFADSGSAATGAATRTRREESNSELSLRGDRANASARRMSRGCQPGP